MPNLSGATFWIFVAVIVVAGHYFRHKRMESRDRLIQAFVEKGQPVPPELLARQCNDSMRGYGMGGAFFLCIGIALAFFLWTMTSGFFGVPRGPAWLPFVAVFPLAMGAALLIGRRGERKDRLN